MADLISGLLSFVGHALEGIVAVLMNFAIAAGALAILQALFCTTAVAGNWAYYTPGQASFALVANVPTLAIDVLIVWATLLGGIGRHRTAAPRIP